MKAWWTAVALSAVAGVGIGVLATLWLHEMKPGRREEEETMTTDLPCTSSRLQRGENGDAQEQVREPAMGLDEGAPSLSGGTARHAHKAPEPENPEIVDEQFSRNRLFFGGEGNRKLEESFVIVVGLGGVGSHCAHMIARTGVRHIRLVDFDNVTLSSLNRHAVATRNDVGIPKVRACAEHFADFLPSCRIDARVEMFTADMADELLSGCPDYVIDAIDDIPTKVDLLLACNRLGLKCLSALGAGGKSDPTQILIGDITDPIQDPLAAKLRWAIRNRIVDKAAPDEENTARYKAAIENIHVIYSCEEPKAQLAELTDEQMDNPEAYGAVPNFRIRILPVLGTMPAVIGIGAASFVLCELANKPFDPLKIQAISQNFAHKTHNRLVRREQKEFGNKATDEGGQGIADQLEVTFLLERVWKMRSAFDFERNRATTRNVNVTRFDRSKPALPYNLVLLTEQEALWLDKETRVTGSLPAMLLQRCEHTDVDYSVYGEEEGDDDNSSSNNNSNNSNGDVPAAEKAASNQNSIEPTCATVTAGVNDPSALKEEPKLSEGGLPMTNKKEQKKAKKPVHPSLRRKAPSLEVVRAVHERLLRMEADWKAGLPLSGN